MKQTSFRSLVFAAVCTLVAACSSSANAELLLYEPFDGYDVGQALSGQGEWVSAGASDSALVREGSLSYSNAGSLPTAGDSASNRDVANDGQSGNGSRLNHPRFGESGTSIWMSFLMQNEIQGGTGWGGVTLFDGDGESLFIGQPGNAATWGLDQFGGGGQALSEAPINAGETAFLLTQIEFADGNDTVNFWVNPPLSGDTPAPDVTKVYNDFTFDNLRVRGEGDANNQAPNLITDEIRVGTTMSSVIPEPSSIVLCLFGLGGVSLFRRRR